MELIRVPEIVVDNFEVRHPRCVSNKSNYKVYAYVVKTQLYIRWYAI